MVQKTAAKFEKTLTTVGYERLSHGDNNAWNALSLALNRQIRLPSLERVSPNGHERSLKDPHSVLVPGRQIRHQEQRPSNLSAEEIEQISRVISHAPLYILSGEQKQILESSCPALYVERGSPTELEKLTLLGDNPIWISRGLIKASEFCRFLNEVQHKPYGDYIGYHHHAGNALLMWSPESKRWMVREGFADYPISNITHECANQFARFYNARLPTVDEMEELISRVAASSVGRSNIGGACDGPTPVGAFGADALGLFDIIGNLYEWVGEPGETALRVGGSFRSSLTEGMQLNLTSCWSVLASHTTGFRIVYD